MSPFSVSFWGKKAICSPLFYLHLTHVFEPSFVIIDVEMSLHYFVYIICPIFTVIEVRHRKLGGYREIEESDDQS